MVVGVGEGKSGSETCEDSVMDEVKGQGMLFVRGWHQAGDTRGGSAQREKPSSVVDRMRLRSCSSGAWGERPPWRETEEPFTW